MNTDLIVIRNQLGKATINCRDLVALGASISIAGEACIHEEPITALGPAIPYRAGPSRVTITIVVNADSVSYERAK